MSQPTEHQPSAAQLKARRLSVQKSHPPAQIPGYDIRSFLGEGAYGEVWVAIDKNTGKQVAIKFYLHRGGVDWSLLSQEVEKLVFLSADRYVVQLLHVGWDTNPPYYIMEYVENGSLEDLLREKGKRPVAEAVEIFRDVATGLLHAHGKGVLHCDLKPANILLDQDLKPRLADFGQSRLTNEQSPALGTLFFMAPEQADLEAMPDARWDVYALGSLLFCLLTGSPPYKSEETLKKIETAQDLPDRLARYRQSIKKSPRPDAHRRTPGVDRALAAIVDRCLEPDPANRFANMQEVIDALEARDLVRSRRPLWLLGLVGPIILLLVMALFGLRGYQQAVHDADILAAERTQKSNAFAAKFGAEKVAQEIDRYFRLVEDLARNERWKSQLAETLADEGLKSIRQTLADPAVTPQALAAAQAEFFAHPAQEALQQVLNEEVAEIANPNIASWITTDPLGNHLADIFYEEPEVSPVGKNYAWRTYFNGEEQDLPRDARPTQHVKNTTISPLFRSTATFTWKVGISAPVMREGQFLGIVALTVEIGRFTKLFGGNERQFAVLVGGGSDNNGVILQHPLFDKLLAEGKSLVEFSDSRYRVPLEQLEPSAGEGVRRYIDPLGKSESGAAYRREWIAAAAPVKLNYSENGSEASRQIDTRLVVLVQEDYEAALGPLHELGGRLFREAVLAMITVILVVLVLWHFVYQTLREPRTVSEPAVSGDAPTPHGAVTVTAEFPPRK